MRAWRVHTHGAPRDVLRLEELPVPDPGPGELRVRVAAFALNYNELDGIRGRYRTVAPPLPFTPGMEVLGRVEATGGRGVDVVFDTVGGEVTAESQRCLGFGGRLLVVGFASGIEAEDEPGPPPRTLCFGNHSLLGVCLAYVDDPLAARRASGFSFPSRDYGARVHREILERLERGSIRTVIGQRVRFESLPSAFDAFERRESVGRTVVTLDSGGEHSC